MQTWAGVGLFEIPESIEAVDYILYNTRHAREIQMRPRVDRQLCWIELFISFQIRMVGRSR